jgi:hypothetical protein
VGSLGSGKQLAPRTSARLRDNFPAVNVYRLNRTGALVPGCTTRMSWPGLTAIVYAEPSGIILAVDGQDSLPVTIVRDPRPRGGDQAYFLCPDCGRRTHDLYAKDLCFACRICHGLDYRSRHINGLTLQLQRSVILQARLLRHRSRQLMPRLALSNQETKAGLDAMIRALERRRDRRRPGDRNE